MLESAMCSILGIMNTSSTFNSSEDYERYFTLKNRKYSVEAEYLENVRTPTLYFLRCKVSFIIFITVKCRWSFNTVI